MRNDGLRRFEALCYRIMVLLLLYLYCLLLSCLSVLFLILFKGELEKMPVFPLVNSGGRWEKIICACPSSSRVFARIYEVRL